MDEGDWDTLNRVRKQRYKDDYRNLDGYFDIPKWVKKEELQLIEENRARGVGDIYTYEEYWNQITPIETVQETNTELSQTVPKDAAVSTVTCYSHSCNVLGVSSSCKILKT